MTSEVRQLESALEYRCREFAGYHGHVLLKLQGTKGWPDRLLITKHGTVVFLEFKRVGGAPRPLQMYFINKLASLEQNVTWITAKEQFQKLIRDLDFWHRSGTRISIKPGEYSGS